MVRGAYLYNLERVPYLEAWDLQRALAAAVSQGALPDTLLLLEHPPVITLGRRTEEGELHVPESAEVEIVETDRGPTVTEPLTFDASVADRFALRTISLQLAGQRENPYADLANAVPHEPGRPGWLAARLER